MDIKRHVLQVLDDVYFSESPTNRGSNLFTHFDPIIAPSTQQDRNYTNVFDMKVNELTREVTWETKRDAKEVLSSLSRVSVSYSRQNTCKTRHDLIAEFFTEKSSTDCSWKVLSDRIECRTTPDLIAWTSPTSVVVMEFGTNAGGGSSGKKAYGNKFAKYCPVIQEFAESMPNITIFYWVVIVCPNEVISTFNLPYQMIDELVARFRIGVIMETEMRQAGVLDERFSEKTESERIIEASIEALAETPMTGEDLIISDQTYGNHLNFVTDEVYMTESIKLMAEKALGLRKERSKAYSDMLDAFSVVEDAIKESGNDRVDGKAVVQMPLFVSEKDSNLSLSSFDHVPIEPTGLPEHVHHVWSRAYESNLRHPERFQESTIEEEMGQARQGGLDESDSNMRSRWHRVEVDMPTQIEIALSLDGYHGKKYKTADFKQQRRVHQQKGFSLSADTSDIKDFVKLLPIRQSEPAPMFSRVESLMKEASTISGNTQEGTDLVKELFTYDLTHAYCTMSAIACELAVSTRQHTSKDEWIHKTLIGEKVELLVSPTNSESHVFFFLRFKGVPIDQKCFRNVHRSGKWWYTDLLSINASRLENFIRAPALFVNSLIHYRVNVSRVEKSMLSIVTEDGFAEELANLTMLIALEDKSQTEEIALNVRYLIMQFSKGDDPLSWPDAGPIIKKTPTLMRSRLTVYLYNQIKTYCFEQWNSLPRRINALSNDIDHSADQFEGLKCPLTLRDFHSFGDAVQVMYLGYSKNKNAMPEENCDFAMIKKIADYVLNVNPAKEAVYKGEADPTIGEIPGAHEFSPSFLKTSCELLKMRFKNQMGGSWQRDLMSLITQELVRVTHHEALATMKASANFEMEDFHILERLQDLEEENFKGLSTKQMDAARNLVAMHKTGAYTNMSPDEWKNVEALITISNLRNYKGIGKGRRNKTPKSCKCFEAVIKELEMSTEEIPLLLSDLSSTFKSVMCTSGGMCCYLFKKNQHGGLREIYVLTFKSRMLQLLPETAAKVMCKACPEEVLTHPDRKITGYETHHKNVISMMGGGSAPQVVHRNSSEDKSKWSQGMNVAAFGFYFCQLLPKRMAQAILRVLHASRNKKILVPEGVASILNRKIKLTDDTYNRLLEDYWSADGSKLFELVKGRLYFKTPTGMWQGILHYCSSLMHVLQTLHYKFICRQIYKGVNAERLRNKLNPIGSLAIDTVVSSDDSATYATVVLPSGFTHEQAQAADNILDHLLKLEVTHSAFFMMVESPKSTISSRGPAEFNSIFNVQRTYISPSNKKVLASSTIPENEDLESRQIVLANMHKDIMEEGVSHFQTYLHGIVNGVLHYVALGSITTRIFSEFSNMLVMMPDPHFGFYLLDSAEIAGVMGYNFIKYNSLKGTNVSLMPKPRDLDALSEPGTYRSGVILTHGDRRRWKNFIRRVTTPGWQEHLEANPKVLYMERGVTKSEIRSRLDAKACSKGIHEALSDGGSLTRTIACTVYLLKQRVLTVSRLDNTRDGGTLKTVEKVSLVGLTDQALIAPDDVNHLTMTEDQKLLMYPHYQLYEAIESQASRFRTAKTIPTVTHRKIRTLIEVRAGGQVGVLPIMTVLRWKWIGEVVNQAASTLEHSWAFYCRSIPWLKETLNATLLSSPFGNHIDMHGFFLGLNQKRASVRVLAKRLRTSHTMDQICELMRFNYYPQELKALKEDKEDEQENPGIVSTNESLVKMSGLYNILSSACNGPITGDVGIMLKEALDEIDISESDLMQYSKSGKFAKACVLIAVLKDMSGPVVEHLMLSSHKGIVKKYILPQKYNTKSKKWEGKGKLYIRTSKVRAEAFVFDSQLIAVVCDNISGLEEEFPVIAASLEADGFNLDANVDHRKTFSMFPELGPASMTDWVCTRRVLTHIPPSTRPGVRVWRETVIKQASLLEASYPLTFLFQGLGDEHLDGTLRVSRLRYKTCAHLELEIVQNGRTLNMMRFYGPKRPTPGAHMEKFRPEGFDDESLLQCWMYNAPLDPKMAWNIIKHLTLKDGKKNTKINKHVKRSLKDCSSSEIEWFARKSLKWRAIGLYKIRLNTFQFNADLPDTETIDYDVKGLMKDVQELNKFFLDSAVKEDTIPVDKEDGFLKEGAGPEALEYDCAMVDDLDERTGPASGAEEENIPITEMEALPGLFMGHQLWDNLISKLDIKGIWDSLQKGIPLSSEAEEIKSTLLEFLEMTDRPGDEAELNDVFAEFESDDEDSDESDDESEHEDKDSITEDFSIGKIEPESATSLLPTELGDSMDQNTSGGGKIKEEEDEPESIGPNLSSAIDPEQHELEGDTKETSADLPSSSRVRRVSFKSDKIKLKETAAEMDLRDQEENKKEKSGWTSDDEREFQEYCKSKGKPNWEFD